MKRILYFGATALGLLFASCQSDDINVPDEGTTDRDGDKTYYVNMRISGDPTSLSRSAGDNGAPESGVDFADGTENEINNAFFVFYDNDGNVVGDLVQVDLGSLKADDQIHGETVEKCYHSTVPVTVRKGGTKPAQVICYINPIEPNGLMLRLNEIQTVARAAIYKNGKKDNKDVRFFAMSNSVYYPALLGEDGKPLEKDGQIQYDEPQVAVKINEDALYNSQGEAESAFTEGKNVIDIYVERYATKLQFKSADPEVYPTGTRVYNSTNSDSDPKSVKLTFVPQYWAVNAMATNSYVIKSFREESSIGDILINNYSYDRLNGIINRDISVGNDKWVWNNPDYHRSYWAMSPAYFQDNYPDVTADLKYITDIKQSYIPYDALAAGTVGYDVNEETSKDPHYFMETTVGSMALASSNPNAAVASVIYVGGYKLQIDGQDELENTTFYTFLRGTVKDNDGKDVDHPLVYFDGTVNDEKNDIICDVEGGESLFKRMLDQTTILYRRTKPGTSSDSFEQLTISSASDMKMFIDALSVEEVSYEVKVEVGGVDENSATVDGKKNPNYKLRNNSRALQFRSNYTSTVEKNADGEDATGGIYIVTQNGYKKIVADNKENKQNDEVSVTEANLALLRQVGMAYKYVTGLAYFSIPVKHFGWYRNGNKNKGNDKIDWTEVRVGDFGMVRNHSYSIDVESITGLADGIGDPSAPIVPPSTSEDYFMAYAVRILKWAVVPTQSVKL